MDITNTYAKALLDSGDLERSEQTIRANMEHLLTVDPELNQTRTMTAHTILASVLRDQSRAGEALEYTSALIRALDESGRDSHYLMSEFLRLHGQVLMDLERYEQSESTLIRAWEHIQRGDSQSTDAGIVRRAITELYERWQVDDGSLELEEKRLLWRHE
tara:strand:- start:58 stop:537 length:480 start_codon:yes stop_codon:yes gene_type:complete